MQGEQRRSWLGGLSAAVPIMVGYLPIAVTFGVIAQQTGIPALQTTLMSMLVFAGASQFMAANMLAAGAGGMEVVLATLVLNFRHFVMSLSLMNRLHTLPARWKLGLASGITDETFAVASLRIRNGKRTSRFFVAGLMLGAWLAWVIGTMLGHSLSRVIPPAISESMSIALYAMFIGLLVPAVREEWRAGGTALASMFLCWGWNQVLDSGWAIVLATVFGGIVGAFWMKEEEE
ncbi:4-azaleucine resistance transporter AzlC [Melghirimyces profundicolus]|uniref:4-azaleucine resistance transporter AzlC n=1 Tax=Melghirimyces profundicolus TaxID=1242148 RepID=A0A2T6C0C2_9BACL|nr:AzlC family ABC transporter permease [Melghirimyces profundicolus]PTX61758.1 4-azaleucine resistance transporter AzlC [Melghirimyces profundicolus]